MRTLIAAPRLSAAANMRAVCPCEPSLAFTSAPCSTRTRTASGFPAAAAIIRAVVRCSSAEFGSAPALSSNSVVAGFPFLQAIIRGVIAPTRVAAFTFAPAARSILVISASSLYAAQCSAVVPSPWAALTSAFCSIRERTASLLPCMAASASLLSFAAETNATIEVQRITLLPNISHSSHLDCDLSRAVAHALYVHASLAKHRQQDVGHRCRILTPDMQISFHFPVGVACQ